MSPEFRKVTLIAASLGLIVSLFLALRPDDGDEEAAAPATTVAIETAPPVTTAASTTSPETAGGEGPGVVHLEYTVVDGAPTGGIARDSVSRGRIVVIRLTSDVADEVHVHGYDVRARVAPGKPATIRFTASAPGRFEIELEERHTLVAELEVRP